MIMDFSHVKCVAILREQGELPKYCRPMTSLEEGRLDHDMQLLSPCSFKSFEAQVEAQRLETLFE